MSTKIYDAYRIKQSKVDNIIDLVNQWRADATEFMKGYEEVHKQVHTGCFYWITFNNEGEELRKKVDSYNQDPSWYIKDYLRESENSPTRDLVLTSVRLRVSIFKDVDYWYFKFYPNERWSYKFLSMLEAGYPELEDFHYQNQTDIPDDISEDEYRARDDKWEELCRGTNDYTTGLIFDVMDSTQFYKILSKYHYSGEKDLYKHLPYDYGKQLVFNKEDE